MPQKSIRVLVVTNMYPQPDRPAFGTFVRDQVEALRAYVQVDVLFIDGRKSRWNYLWGLLRFWCRLIANRYDVIHAHYVFSGIIARLQPFVPVVVTYHGSELGVSPTHWLSRLSCGVHRFFERVIVVSPLMRERLIGTNVRVIPCGVDLDVFKPIPRFEARHRLNLAPDKPLVLWAGEHWQPVKRFYMVEQAVEHVKRALPDAELVLVSGQPHSIVPLYMNACDALVLTSSHEGSPMVVKEAMACNLPVVSVDVGDAAAVIGGTEHCYIVEPTPEAVAEKLYVVLATQPRTRGREHIAHLSADAIIKQIVEIYQELSAPRRCAVADG